MKATRYLVLMLTFVVGACGTLNNTRIQYHRVADQPAKEQQALEQRSATAELSTEYTTNFQELHEADEVGQLIISLQEPIAEQPLCDTLVLKSGIKMPAKVVEIGVNTISSRKCDEPEGEIYNISANLVEEIIHSDGTVTVLATPMTDEEAPQEPKTPTKEHEMARRAAIFGGLAFIPVMGWIFAIIAIRSASIATAQMDKEPNRYHGRKKAKRGRAAAIASLIIGGLLVTLTGIGLGVIFS